MLAFITGAGLITLIEKDRQHIYNKLRRCTDADKRAELLSQRNDCNSALKTLRKNIRTANHIIANNPKIKDNIKIFSNKDTLLRIGKIQKICFTEITTSK